MSSDKEMKKSLSEMMESITDNKRIISALEENDKTVIELLNVIYQRVEDMSKKFDEVLNIGLKKPRINLPLVKETTPTGKQNKSPPKKTPNSVVTKPVISTINKDKVKPVNNIMTYFKKKYIEDDTTFDNILEENQAEALFEEHKDDIASKKDDNARKKTKVTLLYKSLTKEQKSKIREKMLNEHERSTINNSDELAEESS
jgi:hypothetical protein